MDNPIRDHNWNFPYVRQDLDRYYEKFDGEEKPEINDDLVIATFNDLANMIWKLERDIEHMVRNQPPHTGG